MAGEANGDRRPDPASAVARSGAALLLDLSPCGATGFGSIAFRTHEEDGELFGAVVSLAEPRGRLFIRRLAQLEEAWLRHVSGAVDEALAREGLARDRIDLVVPAQVSAGFLSRLPAAIGVPADRVVDYTATLPDTGSTSVFLAWQRQCAERQLAPGSRVLFLVFGSGLTVGAAIYTV